MFPLILKTRDTGRINVRWYYLKKEKNNEQERLLQRRNHKKEVNI